MVKSFKFVGRKKRRTTRVAVFALAGFLLLLAVVGGLLMFDKIRIPFLQEAKECDEGDTKTVRQCGGFGCGVQMYDATFICVGGKWVREKNEPNGFAGPGQCGCPAEAEYTPSQTPVGPPAEEDETDWGASCTCNGYPIGSTTCVDGKVRECKYDVDEKYCLWKEKEPVETCSGDQTVTTPTPSVVVGIDTSVPEDCENGKLLTYYLDCPPCIQAGQEIKCTQKKIISCADGVRVLEAKTEIDRICKDPSIEVEQCVAKGGDFTCPDLYCKGANSCFAQGSISEGADCKIYYCVGGRWEYTGYTNPNCPCTDGACDLPSEAKQVAPVCNNVTTDKATYTVGETITATCSVSNADQCRVSVIKDGEIVFSNVGPCNMAYTVWQPGNYEVRCDAFSLGTYKTSDNCKKSFNILAPTANTPTLTVTTTVTTSATSTVTSEPTTTSTVTSTTVSPPSVTVLVSSTPPATGVADTVLLVIAIIVILVSVTEYNYGIFSSLTLVNFGNNHNSKQS